MIKSYPALVDGAFVIIAWVALKLVADYARAMGWIEWEIHRPIELGM
jgi:predicted tellurium resistance membrane protein TerC